MSGFGQPELVELLRTNKRETLIHRLCSHKVERYNGLRKLYFSQSCHRHYFSEKDKSIPSSVSRVPVKVSEDISSLIPEIII